MHCYRDMSLIRAMEMGARALYQEKKIRGFLHDCVGQVCVCLKAINRATEMREIYCACCN